jgi:hypothetical protein
VLLIEIVRTSIKFNADSSLACWVVVFSPQIIENFRRSSAEGLSIEFVIIWLLGDFANIIGAVMQRVLPTMVSLRLSNLMILLPKLIKIPPDHPGHLLHICGYRLTGPMLLLPRLPLQRSQAC